MSTDSRPAAAGARAGGPEASQDAASRGVAPRGLRIAADWSWRLLVVAALVAVIGYVASVLLIVVVPVFVALLGAAVLAPLVELTVRRGVPRLAAVWGVTVAALLVVGGVGYAMWRGVESDRSELSLNVESAAARVERWLVESGLPAAQVERGSDRIGELIGGAGGTGLLSGARTALEIASGAVLALVLVFFFLKDGPRIWRWVTGLAPAGLTGRVDEAGRAAWTSLGGWVRGTAVVALADAVLIGAALAVLGVPFVLPLAVITFVAAFFPVVGAVAAGALAALVALAANGPVSALLVIAAVTVVQQVEGNVLQPIIVGRAVELHPVAILLALAAGAAVAGIVGAFLAVPGLAAASAAAHALRRGAGSAPRILEGTPAAIAADAGRPGPRAGPPGESG